MFSVPNGAHLSAIQAKILKGEGMTAGVADVLFLHPSADGAYAGLAIEFKTAKGRQSESAEFRAWLEKTIHDKNYTLSGVSRAMGFSGSWLWNIVRGKRRLPKKRCSELDQALALPAGTVARQLRKTGNKGSKNTTI